MPWAVKVGKKTVRFDDLAPAAWIRINEERGNWAEVYTAPLKDPAAMLLVLEECIKVADPGCGDIQTMVESMTPRMRDLADLLVEVDDDMPTVVTDGVPPEGDGGSTGG